ncbi:hypothetical protein L202_05667 [Cryptococcus amylolentus CBS 6039]|uniref:histone acetyltransferase n=1 Tax=Cryptococcus amylolentus CBS 6039 TaxID=1295533 RepID=A0A1E3HN36_9TREE|nr:hypothetical protein L202_05667 [Cryptococcus amylolentus CBS 6039]ODN77136.1 hypothetical protein L202_05667 [Cryptococcus amylolentus CBS 6039]
MSTPESLRTHLLSSLSPLPNTSPLGLTILASHPKRTKDLYPHAVNPPKALKQDWLVVLDSEVKNHGQTGGEGQEGSQGATVGGEKEGEGVDGDAGKGKKPRVLVAAISAYLYTFPSPSSSPSSPSSPPAILYISKVDSSGYSSPSAPLPHTRHLIRSFLTFFISTHPYLRVQLFARAQKQYLFANSGEGGGKKVLGGMGLCKWWKGVYEESVSAFAEARAQAQKEKEKEGAEIGRDVKLAFILPGYDQSEAHSLLGPGRPLPAGIAWSYTPPFLTPVVGGSEKETEVGLAGLIPSLPDDPKTRFLEELVDGVPRLRGAPASVAAAAAAPIPAPTATTSTSPSPSSTSPARHQPQAQKEKDHTSRKTRETRETEHDLSQRTHAQACLAKVGMAEFWERMGFRQECASGDVTGFFSLETLPLPSRPVPGDEQGAAEPSVTMVELPSQALLPPPITDRILTALTNLDFATRELAIEGSGIWLDQTQGLVRSEVGKEGWEKCVGTVEAKVGVEGPGTGAGEGVGVGGEKRAKKEEVVTMLQPRKKKKVA